MSEHTHDKSVGRRMTRHVAPSRAASCLCLLSARALLLPAVARGRQPGEREALAAMKRATQFMLDKVAHRGGYVWSVSEDFRRRDGEVPARATQIWIQGGTPHVGHAYLDAYEATREPLFLEAARRAADALAYGQRPEGGWHYFIDFDPKGLEEWYRNEASRFKWGYEEYRHYYGDATFDDGNSSSAARYYQPGTNLPVYVLRTDKTNAEGYGLYQWSTTDARGAWVTDGIMVLTRVPPPAMNPGTRGPIRGYSTGVFIRNLGVLTEHVRTARN